MTGQAGTTGGWLPPGDAAPPLTGTVAAPPVKRSEPEPADWLARVAASVIDSIVSVGALICAGLFAGPVVEESAASDVARVLAVAAWLLYPPLMLAFNGGRTLGKIASEIKVINMSGEPVGFGRALLREIAVKLPLSIFPLGLINALWPLWQADNRALHDLIVGTRVIVNH
jgi:uncharacterized RDD family membrane protein YckC